MKQLKKWLMGFVLLPLFLSSSAFAEDIKKVVYHVDFEDPARYSATLTSVSNMLNEYENALVDYEVSIVYVGFGARFVTDSAQAGTSKIFKERKAELKERTQNLNSMRKVKLAVCNNTLNDFDIEQKELHSGVSVVPSGVVHVAELQEAGASYIKIQ